MKMQNVRTKVFGINVTVNRCEKDFCEWMNSREIPDISRWSGPHMTAEGSVMTAVEVFV